jgi:chlorobactene glucosyltransferase
MIHFYISTVIFIGGIFIVYWLHNQYHLDIVVEPTPPPPNASLISICVPASNEERNIRACVKSILAQDYPNFEVIVLEDRSTDATPEILHSFLMEPDGARVPLSDLKERVPSLQIIRGSDPPKGWAGKPHALFQASASARGEWLCFVDADTFLSPATLSSCYAKAIEIKADMFTILTFQVIGSFWEKVVMPIVMTALSVGFSPRKVNNPKSKDAIANGQFILIKPSVYDAVGGHERIKYQIVEEKAIAEQVKWNGYRLIVADGYALARTRLILWAIVVYARARVAIGLGISPWYALTLPLGAAVFAAMMFTSTWKILFGKGVTWKGRMYAPK